MLVKGRASEVVDPEVSRRAGDLGLDFWDVGEKAHWIRIEPREVTGRRIGPCLGAVPVWSTPYPRGRGA